MTLLVVKGMRADLQALEGRRVTFTATFEKYGVFRKHGVVGRTILLKDVRTLDGRFIAQHIWLNYTAGFDKEGEFVRGERVQFTAMVKPYVKGYFGDRIEDRLARPYMVDYRFTYPRDVVRIGIGAMAAPSAWA